MLGFLVKPKFNINFNDGAFVECTKTRKPVTVNFYGEGKCIHSDIIQQDQWVRAFRSYYTKWNIECSLPNGHIVFRHQFSLENMRVRVNIDSKSLGDTIAWIPQIVEFARIHPSTIVHVSHFWPNLFDISGQENLKYVSPDNTVEDCYATYSIGYFFSDIENRHPLDPRLQPLGKVASDILGLAYKERLPTMQKVSPNPIPNKPYICIATKSTAECKHWLTENGWQQVIDYIVSRGYDVYVIQKEQTQLRNIVDKTGDINIEDRIADLENCKFMIGLGSGLSWLAWALRKPVVLISGFSLPYAEFENNCYRVINQNVCHGCWNNTNYTFDRDDWNWCPLHKDTERAFECSKSISVDSVLSQINKII